MLHIGIVACSAEGAALCYRTICAEAPQLMGKHAHPEISMHTHSLAEYVDALERDDLNRVGDLMLSSAQKLARAGADFLICPDNTIHQAFDSVAPRSPLPWLHIAHAVADDAERRGFTRLGLLGTRYLLEGDVYSRALAARGLEYVLPGVNEKLELHRIIMEELVYGRFDCASIDFVQREIDAMRERGCEAVILGCTELPLIVNEEISATAVLDSTRILARAALHRALEFTRTV